MSEYTYENKGVCKYSEEYNYKTVLVTWLVNWNEPKNHLQCLKQ